MQVGGGLTLVDWEVGRKGWGVILKRGEGEWAVLWSGLKKRWAWGFGGFGFGFSGLRIRMVLAKKKSQGPFL